MRFTFRGPAGSSKTRDAGRSEEEAVAVAKAVWAGYIGGHLEAPAYVPQTMRELVDEYADRPNLAPATVRGYTSKLDLWLRFIGETVRPSSVGRNHIQAWLDAMTCKEISKWSYLQVVRALFKYAMDEDYITGPNPCAKVKVAYRMEMRPWLDAEDWPAFLSKCGRSHHIRSGFVLETGLRAGELMAARWEWIQPHAGMASIRVAPDAVSGFTTKRGKARSIPLSAEALRVLELAKDVWGNAGYIFSNFKLTSPNFPEDTRAACVAAGVTSTDFHGLRRSAGARWVKDGVPLHMVQKWLGHSSIVTTMKHYAGISDSEGAKWMRHLNQVDRQVAYVPQKLRIAGDSASRETTEGPEIPVPRSSPAQTEDPET